MQNLSNQPAGCTTCFSRSLFLSLSFFLVQLILKVLLRKRIVVSLLVDAEKSDCKVNDTAVTIGRVYVSFEGPQHPLGGYFDTLNHSTKSGSKGPEKTVWTLDLHTGLKQWLRTYS